MHACERPCARVFSSCTVPVSIITVKMLRKGKGTDRQDSMMIHYSTRSRWSHHLEFPVQIIIYLTSKVARATSLGRYNTSGFLLLIYFQIVLSFNWNSSTRFTHTFLEENGRLHYSREKEQRLRVCLDVTLWAIHLTDYSPGTCLDAVWMMPWECSWTRQQHEHPGIEKR